MRILVALLLLSAGSSTAQTPESVVFDAADGGRVYADVYGKGAHGVVLAHGAVFNKESWREQATALAASGVRVVAIDFRGYGKSEAGSEEGALHLDVLAAVRWLRQNGAERVGVVGGSMGGGAAAQAAVEAKSGEIDDLVLLAHSPIAQAEKLQGRKLFIVSEGDGLLQRIRQQHSQAPGPKKLVVLPGRAHAQHIFKSDEGQRLLDEITAWLLD